MPCSETLVLDRLNQANQIKICWDFAHLTRNRVPPDSRLMFGNHQENGNDDVHWLKVFVDSHSPALFTYQEQIVSENQTVVSPL